MKPILMDFPYAFQSERLDIRGPLPGDGTELNRAVRESKEELKKWMPWALKTDSVEESEIRVREGQLKFLAREDLWLMLFLKGTNTIIGGSGLHRIDWSVSQIRDRILDTKKGVISPSPLSASPLSPLKPWLPNV